MSLKICRKKTFEAELARRISERTRDQYGCFHGMRGPVINSSPSGHPHGIKYEVHSWALHGQVVLQKFWFRRRVWMYLVDKKAE
jgi:hypothetical protein